jgi:hypothetical protein
MDFTFPPGTPEQASLFCMPGGDFLHSKSAYQGRFAESDPYIASPSIRKL